MGPTALFVINTFFFIAGLFAAPKMTHVGPRRFVHSRVVRLGIPWLLFILLVWPMFMWLAYRSAGRRMPYWQFFWERGPFLDSGPLWFVQVLLYVSIGYALWTWVRRGRPFPFRRVAGRHLVAAVR